MNDKTLNIKILGWLLILTLSATFSFCGDEPTEESTHFGYTVNGNTQNVQSITGLLQSVIQYEHEERGLTINVLNNLSGMITLSMSNWDFQNPPDNGILEGEYDATFDFEQMNGNNPNEDCLELTGDNAGITLCSGGMIKFTLDGDVYTSIFDGNTEATITITKCKKKSITGEFTAIVKNADGEELTVSGKFKNVKYTVF